MCIVPVWESAFVEWKSIRNIKFSMWNIWGWRKTVQPLYIWLYPLFHSIICTRWLLSPLSVITTLWCACFWKKMFKDAASLVAFVVQLYSLVFLCAYRSFSWIPLVMESAITSSWPPNVWEMFTCEPISHRQDYFDCIQEETVLELELLLLHKYKSWSFNISLVLQGITWRIGQILFNETEFLVVVVVVVRFLKKD